MTSYAQKEMLEDVLQLLDWYKSCGADAWPVEDLQIWEQKLANLSTSTNANSVQAPSNSGVSKPSFLQRNSHTVTSGSSAGTTTTTMSFSLSSEKPKTVTTAKESIKQKDTDSSLFSLPGDWGMIGNDAPVPIDFSILNEKDGLHKIKDHQRQYCKSNKPCSLGAGRPQVPVLIIEGHERGLTPEAKLSLGKIVDFLSIPRQQMYWLPFPLRASTEQSQDGKLTTCDGMCALCPNLFLATLECLTPKIVLVMGEALEGNITMLSENGGQEQPTIGSMIQMSTHKWTIPGLWTHHPTDMNENMQLKSQGKKHLDNFKIALRRNNII